jgi:hypothetical protein
MATSNKSDYELLKSLQSELIQTLEKRKKIDGWIPRSCCKAKIRRLRLQIQELMLRIEQNCNAYKNDKEKWE